MYSEGTYGLKLEYGYKNPNRTSSIIEGLCEPKLINRKTYT